MAGERSAEATGVNETAARPTADSGINETAARPTADYGINETAARPLSASRRSRRDQMLSEGAPVPIGTRIDVLWDQDEWYAGILIEYNIINGLSQLLYDDGDNKDDNKWHDLTVDRWCLSSKTLRTGRTLDLLTKNDYFSLLDNRGEPVA